MKKITEKVALIAQICITLVFVITTLLYMSNVIPEDAALANNGVLATLVVILSIVYGLLSAYLIYQNFAERENLRQILLYCDSESATHATTKVINNIVRSCAQKTEGVRVKKTKVRIDEKQGLVITLKVDASCDNVSLAIDKLRCLLADSFKNTLNLTFSSINFEIRKLKTNYQPNEQRAEQMAKTLTEQKELATDIYEQPFEDNCEKCKEERDRSEETDESEASEKENKD